MGCRESTNSGGNNTTGGIESEIVDKPKPFPADDETVIEVKKVDLEVRKNVLAHRTDGYSVVNSETLVIRRGQEFNITVEFNRPYDVKNDDLRMVFQHGPNPHPRRDSHVEFVLSDKDTPKEWGAFIENTNENSLSLVVNTSPLCAVTKWSLKIDVVKRSDTGVAVYRYKHTSPIYILFNPWCKDDSVYMEDDKQLTEYVLNETGIIYAGSSGRISKKPWSFGQFEDFILDCALYLLDKSKLADKYRGDPVYVTRKISQMVNSSDDWGVLMGNWSSDYAGGRSPLYWTGSVEILQQYYKTKKPVKFGQCWVFSGVTTTVCRALGIPTRSVTNFSSAHDTEKSMTIDTYYNEDFEVNERLTSDSVWNFHVWNEVWLARPELPAGLGGWQVIDATPQETSEGMYCLGPVSTTAIKRGDVSLPYDGPFVFAEVNADRLYWFPEDGRSRKYRVINIQKTSVGKNISTKQVGQNVREDITDQYKYKEGSEEERAAVRRANLHSTGKYKYETTAQDVVFDVKTDLDTFMGDSIKINLEVKNTSDSKRTVHGKLEITSITYTGVLFRKIKQQSLRGIVLEPGEERDLDMVVKTHEYLDLLADHCISQIYATCKIDETGQIYAEQEELRLRKPHLDIKAPTKGNVGEKFEVEVSFKNPLSVSLTKCELTVDGPGLQKPTTYKQPNVDANATYTGSFEMTPMKPGEREIIVSFNCDKINAVNASHSISVSGR